LLDEFCGGPELIVRGIAVNVLGFPALIAGDREGVAIFSEGTQAELLLLHALREGCGIGSALLEAVLAELRAGGTADVRVMTTNDNLRALRFYQRRGFRLRALRVGAVDAARRLKPAIPQHGADGIPMRDEIELIAFP
ncbi:MAG TPA: GNAT family N-acetyltransferase, partial [Candidatus Cybelea sp.]